MMWEKLRESVIRRGQALPSQTQLSGDDQATIEAMIDTLRKGDARARPSRYWEELNKLNLAQAAIHGYSHFKRNIALNYFTWATVLPWNSQVVFLIRFCSLRRLCRIVATALRARDARIVGKLRRRAYDWISLLLWEYILSRAEIPAELLALREPVEGDPLIVEPRPRMKVTQDLGNSILEYQSFCSALPACRPTVLELGAGYGRNAYVILERRRDAKLIIVDIPPALWVSQRYLSAVFPSKRIFRFRDFADFNEVAEEFAQADIAFILSTQITHLPSELADVIINISSLHEMRPDQIAFYFQQFDRLLRRGGHMYSKQWREAKVLFEQVTLVESDYPVPAHWKVVYSRRAAVQSKFFEALYRDARTQ
jgi:putative sugar O-methyltransferase